MITENYVSYDTAKLLKEKGFNEECSRFYMPNGYVVWKYDHYHNFDIRERIECPTLQMAMKWLREVHKMFIQVELYSKYENYCFELFQNTHRLMVEHREVYSTYEEACEAAIKYCLEKLF